MAVGLYKGFFNIAEHAINTELHIAIAKLYDSHKDALHIEKLVNYAEQNQVMITSAQQRAFEDDIAYTHQLIRMYEGLERSDLLAIKHDLDSASDKIARLKEVRDKQVAHEDISKPEIAYLTYQELADLIELSERILNLISGKIYGNTAWFELYKKQVIEDTKSLLRLISRSEGVGLKK